MLLTQGPFASRRFLIAAAVSFRASGFGGNRYGSIVGLRAVSTDRFRAKLTRGLVSSAAHFYGQRKDPNGCTITPHRRLRVDVTYEKTTLYDGQLL